jgi:cytochrome P460
MLLNGNSMNRHYIGSCTSVGIAISVFAAVTIGIVIFMPLVSGQADNKSAPVFVTKAPPGYRDWKLISIAHEEGNLNSFSGVLGNDVAIKAYREKMLPFPDGAIIAALHYRYTPSEENNKVFGRPQSFAAGPPTNVQFMIKDSKKYAATSGWGFGHFNNDGTLGDGAMMKTCFPCHAQEKTHDLVFTQYAP